MLKIILIAVPAIIVLFLIIAALQPSDFRLTRSARMAAAPQTIFPHVNDLHKWREWSPWAKLDPTSKVTFEGPPAGTGASYTWDGNNRIGKGRMTIIESRANDLIRFKLEFLKPMKATNVAEFTFKAEGNQTLVTWMMSGKNSFIGKAFGLIVNCDKMVGCQFEKGLADLRSLAEAPPQ